MGRWPRGRPGAREVQDASSMGLRPRGHWCTRLSARLGSVGLGRKQKGPGLQEAVPGGQAWGSSPPPSQSRHAQEAPCWKTLGF